MQGGLFFIWLISFAVTFILWIYWEWVQAREGAFQGRRRVTGCELARQVLDRNLLNRIAVTPDSDEDREQSGPRFNRLVLPEKVYYGTRSANLATSLHEACRLVAGKGPRRGGFFRAGILAAWLLIGGGILLPAWPWIFQLGQFLFVLAFLFVLLFWVEEGEIIQRAVSSLAFLEGLGPDELTRMRRLLGAMRGGPFAELIQIPLSILFRNKRKIPAGVS